MGDLSVKKTNPFKELDLITIHEMEQAIKHRFQYFKEGHRVHYDYRKHYNMYLRLMMYINQTKELYPNVSAGTEAIVLYLLQQRKQEINAGKQ